MKTLKELALDALRVQNTSNALGVSKGYAQMLTDLNLALKNEGEKNGTSDLARHPINQLWVNKLHDLAGMNFETEKRLVNALDYCQKLAQPELVDVKLPICANCQSGEKKVATHRLWCPSWIGSQNGPMDLCDEHAAHFRPKDNEDSKGGSWHWGEEADKAFKSVVQNFPHTHGNYANAKGMTANGQKVGKKVFVVDGWAWLVASYNVLNLGSWPEVKEVFPALFNNE